MKKTIFTFFVACNLAMSGFFAVLATSPALAAGCPLCKATGKNVAEVRRLLSDGVNPNQADTNGNTALIYAVVAGHPQIVKALLDGGANPNQATADGNTALILAMLADHPQIVKALLDGGANPNQADSSGTTALRSALSLWRVDIAKILSDASDSSWLFSSCTTDEMTDDKNCHASSIPIASSAANNAARVSYSRDCADRSDWIGVTFNTPQTYNVDTQNFQLSPFLVRSDDKPAVKIRFFTSDPFLSKWVNFYDPAEAIALIKHSNNIRIRFPFLRGSEVIKFPMNGATAAIEKTREECKK